MLYPTGRYNLNFDICAMLIAAFLLIYFHTKKDMHSHRTRLFMWLVSFMMFSSLGEFVSDIIRNGGWRCSPAVATFFTIMSHFCHNSVGFLMMSYLLVLTGLWHAFSKRAFCFFSLPETALAAVLLIPYTRNLLFSYDDQLQYTRGPFIWFYNAVIAFYTVCCLYLLIRYYRTIRRKDFIYVSILGIGFLLCMILERWNTYLRATNFLQTLCLMGSFIAIENDDDLIDAETGLYNIYAMVRDIHPLFSSRYISQVLAVKLQHFNYYRLMLGIDSITSLLSSIGNELKQNSSDDVSVYRISNGEFVIVLFNRSEEDARELAEKLRARFTKPWQYASVDASVTIPAQVWMTSIPDKVKSEEQFLVFAESPFNDDLPKGKIYVADEMKSEERRIDVELAIRRALEHNSFQVYYQPIYDTGAGLMHSCEALVRMNDEKLGFVSPEEFIKIAEQTGTVSQIGAIVFEKVCQFLASEKPSQYGLKFVEVNLSTIQCMDEDLVEQFQVLMKKYGISPSQIVLEITESAIIHNEETMQQAVKRLKDAGFTFALDDFGTGHANYSYVLNFPFRLIKIDKSFLWSADKSENNRIILNNMLSLVDGLKLQAVVEGVETEHQRDELVQAGVAYLQGFYYSKPVPQEQFLEYIRKFNLACDG